MNTLYVMLVKLFELVDGMSGCIASGGAMGMVN